jgi:hypothetical protein
MFELSDLFQSVYNFCVDGFLGKNISYYPHYHLGSDSYQVGLAEI